MHSIVLTAGGVVGVLLVALIAHAVNRRRRHGFIDGGRLFIWIWLVISVANFAIGTIESRTTAMVELGIFAVVFGIPVALALAVSHSLRKRRPPTHV